MAEGEELQRAVCHLSLDVLDAGGSCVFSGFGVIIKEVWGKSIFRARHCEGSDGALKYAGVPQMILKACINYEKTD